MLFEELGVITQLKAVSSFHPILDKTIPKLGGGLFLTKKAFDQPELASKGKKKIIFFDQSMEMRRTLSKLAQGEILEVFTRKLGAFEAFKVSVEIASSFLIGCEKRLQKLNLKVEKIKKSIKERSFSKTILFYLGRFKKNKNDPNLLIVNDGFVKDLLSYTDLKTYPSSLEYVTWSQKVMKKLNNSIKISVTDGKKEKIEVKKMGDNKYSVIFRGALSPGIRQVYLLKELVSMAILQ